MKTFFAFVVAALLVLQASAAIAGPCTYPDDRASDGSRCGDRASTVRPGGANGP